MFIPRTLAVTESTGRGAWARAAIVGGFLAVAIAPRADIRDRQLRLYDAVARSVRSILLQRDAGTIDADLARSRLSAALPGFSDDQITTVSTLAADTWT